METLENKRRYEWVTTSRIGKVETYLADDETTVYFESGRFVQKEQLDSLLHQIDEDIFQLKFSQQEREVIQPQILENQFETWESMLGNPEPVQQLPAKEEVKVDELNPIKIILDKQRKKETITVLFDINIDVPNKKVLDLLDVMFEREEVIEEIIKSSIQKLDQNAIIKKIHESIKEKILSLFDEEKDDVENEMQIS